MDNCETSVGQHKHTDFQPEAIEDVAGGHTKEGKRSRLINNKLV